MKYILMVIFLSLPITANAAWPEAGMNPEITPTVRFQPQHRMEPVQPAHQYAPPVVTHSNPVHQYQPPQQAQYVRHDQPADHRQEAERHEQAGPNYFRHDTNYYGYVQVPFPYADVDSGFVVPDGFEAIMVNGETFYYNQGSFYQQINDQLVAIPAVLGAVVDYIPEDYQIVMADGVHYLFTQGVYYQRVDQGFMVVQPPAIDQE